LTPRYNIDVADLPTWSFGSRSLMWWGTLGYIGIELSGFGLALAVYLYLAQKAQEWPLAAPPPDLLPGMIMTALLLLSLLPNYFVKHSARGSRLGATQLGLVIMSILGLLPLIVRIFEFKCSRR
jgi:cytochrome c oxidase subunit 3